MLLSRATLPHRSLDYARDDGGECGALLFETVCHAASSMTVIAAAKASRAAAWLHALRGCQSASNSRNRSGSLVGS